MIEYLSQHTTIFYKQPRILLCNQSMIFPYPLMRCHMDPKYSGTDILFLMHHTLFSFDNKTQGILCKPFNTVMKTTFELD